MKVRLFIGAFLIIIGICTSANAQTSGQVMFVGFNADGNDGFAFVTLVDIPNGNNIHFNDNEWDEVSAFNDNSETEMTWQNNTGSAITAGTVITITDSNTTPVVDIGTITTGTISLAASNEVLYMFLGVDNETPTTFLSAIANDGFSLANGSLVNTGLTAGVNAVSITGDEDIMIYLNNSNCNGTVAECAMLIATSANWDTEDGGGDQSSNGTFPDFPTNVCDVAGTLFFPMTTYYSRASGAWDSNTSWSLSADGSTGAVPAGVWPRRTDNVVIGNAHSITINAVNDNKSCGNSPNGLNRSNVSAFTGSADLMFYQTGDILISNGGTLVSSEEIMIEGYTHVENGGTLNVNEDIINLGYFEVSASTTFSNTDDLILSGNSITIINNTSTGFDDIYIDHTNATLCGTGVMNIGNGSPDPTIQYFNGASLNQICSSFTVTCSTNCPGGFPMTGTGNFSSGNSGPGGVGDQNTNEIWLMADKGAYTDAGITLAADLNTVQRWHDNSGNGRNAFQNTAGNRPIYRTGQDNGFPALQFTGNLFIDSPSLGIAGTSDLTYFITFKDTQTGLGGINDGGGHYILDRTTATNELMSLKPITGNVYTLQKRSNAGTGLGGPASTTVINTNIKWVEMTRDNGTAYNFFYNGVSESSLADGDGNLTPPAMRIGRHATSNNGGLRGFIHELFVYSSLVNNAQRVLINNYLSAKYGVSLSVNDVYTMDNPVNGDYDAEVAGIGQSSDGSYHKDAKGNGVVRMWNPKGLSNSEFLMWGHDNTALNSSTTAVGTAVDGTVIQERLSRIWRVSETGDVGTVSISFDFSGVGGSPLGSNLRLLIDRDGDGFADNDVTPIAGSVSNGIAVFSNVNFQNGDRFTLGNTDASSPLPVELVMFKASPLRDAIKLNWTTASELNNDYFNIERSSDAEQWVSIATIAGVGTTNETNTYETMDYQPIEGVSYYRLKQTDFDGKISFSPIERVDFVGQNSIQVFPNPSDAIFHLANSAQLDIESIKVLNNLGQIVFPVIRKDENIMIDLSHLSSGIYILQVWNGTFLSNARLIKRN